MTSGDSTATQEEVDAENEKTRAEAMKKGGNTAHGASSLDSTTGPLLAEAAALSANPSAAGTRPAAAKGKGKAPVKRKPRQSLESMSAALDKGKKMTTLEKVHPVIIS